MSGFAPQVEAALARESQRTGVPIDTLRSFARIESGGNPNTMTGSYRGLFQLSPSEFNRHGGGSSIYDVDANAAAGASKIAADSAAFARQHGRQPSAAEIYMIHQQGAGGAAAHWANPDRPAWQNMASTGEGRQRGEGWARQAIWGNVPSNLKAQYGSVDNMTSRQFTDMWASKFGGPSTAPAVPSMGQPTDVPVGRGAMDRLSGFAAPQLTQTPGSIQAPALSMPTAAPGDLRPPPSPAQGAAAASGLQGYTDPAQPAPGGFAALLASMGNDMAAKKQAAPAPFQPVPVAQMTAGAGYQPIVSNFGGFS